ncbi:putative uncharacterized protein [Parachlamydia acanthamoebae UV-7]|jgi:predicted DNA-binding protein with PD1-like motif|uniref:PPC domain-containing protein n=1 Tax=Parachlamydia acanthamoebae (strain UV7) TaxID=765952 RepID=F8KZ67_PARAV|nr:PPC domain-containing DNA-binding protein [Parachlamydia acanthamoebae]CCB86190.1 putative uncharacterized protein [Parachlamydia acanthamoebae UV-7]
MKRAICLLICSLFTLQIFAAEDYMEVSKAVPHGQAQGVKVKLLSDSNGVKNYVLIFAEDDEVLTGIADFANKHQVKSAHFTAIGALKKATTGWYDVVKKMYKLHYINEQVELISLIGDIALQNGKPIVHAHFAVGYPDGKVEGGHLIEAYTFPTVEMFITVEPASLYKDPDPKTGLNLINPDSKE